MKKSGLVSTLKDLGLSDKESRVYLAGLSLGACTISQLAHSSEVNRTTVYPVIESLQRKGLMSIEPQGFKRRFLAEPPSKLKAILSQRKAQFTTALPELEALYSLKGSENFIKYYEGEQKIQRVYEELLHDVATADDYLVVSNQDKWLRLSPQYFKDFIRRRAEVAEEHDLTVKMLLQDTVLARKHKKTEKKHSFKIKLLPKGSPLSTNIVITSHRLVIHQFDPPSFAMVIQNENIIQIHKELFEITWRSIK